MQEKSEIKQKKIREQRNKNALCDHELPKLRIQMTNNRGTKAIKTDLVGLLKDTDVYFNPTNPQHIEADIL